MHWKIEGFESENPTGFSREEAGSQAKITLLLERLVARHLTDDEITEATLGSGAHFHINRDKQPGKPILLMTTGNPYYV
ncbi:MAG: hypothetical protein WA620_03050, partial [Methylovirgula sp.]